MNKRTNLKNRSSSKKLYKQTFRSKFFEIILFYFLRTIFFQRYFEKTNVLLSELLKRRSFLYKWKILLNNRFYWKNDLNQLEKDQDGWKMIILKLNEINFFLNDWKLVVIKKWTKGLKKSLTRPSLELTLFKIEQRR